MFSLSFVLFAQEEAFCLDESIKSHEDIRLIASINYESGRFLADSVREYKFSVVDSNKLSLKYDSHNIT